MGLGDFPPQYQRVNISGEHFTGEFFLLPTVLLSSYPPFSSGVADDDLEVSWRVNEFGRMFLFAGGVPAAAAGHPNQAEVHGRLPPGLLPRVHPDLAREIPRGDLDSPSQILSTRSPAERPRRSKLFCRHETSCAEPWKTQSEGEIIHAFSWNYCPI